MSYQLKLETIFDEPFFTNLLKNDVVIFGQAVRELVINGLNLKEFSEKEYNVINAYAKAIFIDIIERDLYKYISRRTIISPGSSNKNTIISYDIEIGKHSFILDIIYVKTILSLNILNFQKDLNCLINIDCLSIKRTGIYILDILDNIPFVFKDLVKEIKKKKFNFIEPLRTLGELNFKYIKEMQKNGYRNLDNVISNFDATDTCECNICYDKDEKMEFVQFPCKHIYHKKCIESAIKVFFSEKKFKRYFKCPYCNTEYSHKEII
jgi:hypothetical protein